MGTIVNPENINSFIKLVKGNDKSLFVDKTDFIKETNERINQDINLLAFTRPRRFGKTITAHMLSAYYSKGYAGQHIFDGLKITGNDYRASFEKHLNKYDVIYIDMNSVNAKYRAYIRDDDKVKGVHSLLDYLEYDVISELKEDPRFTECLSRNKITNIGVFRALTALHKDLNTQFIFIMDEWDLIYREFRDDTQLQEDFINMLRDLFKSDDGQACFALAYLTGILPIKKYNSQSALNNFDEYNMLTPGEYTSYFGFTEGEVDEIVSSRSCKVSRNQLKSWYEGYKINNVDIYNPNSVCKAVMRNECISYWSGTSSNEEVVRLINLNFKGIKSDIIKLIEGAEVPFTCINFQNDMVSIEDKDDVFSLLVCLGFLGCSNSAGEYNKKAYVPNTELRLTLMKIVRSQNWYKRMQTIKRSEKLLKAILKLDGNTVATIIQEIHNSKAVSLLTYNNEESLTYCIMTGLLWSTLDDYTCHREEQSGKGRVDVVYQPYSMEHPLILIEFKYDTSAEEALSQIKSREYFKGYMAEYLDIIMVGINYSTQTKEHQCVIEKFNINGNASI